MEMELDPSRLCRDDRCERTEVHVAHAITHAPSAPKTPTKSVKEPWRRRDPRALDHCIAKAVSQTYPRHVAAIVEAYTTPGRPSWEHARFYAGTASSEEVVSPSLRAQVLRRAKDESDIANVRARVLRGSGGSEDTAAGTAAGGAGSRGAGRGRGKGGRGDPPPAGS